MPFIDRILDHKSLAIVGLEKNTGKTVCLNYVLRRLAQLGVPTAVTSIGVDGEQTDSVYGSAKPEVTLYENNIFITSEKHYKQRELVSEILAIDNQRTALGRLVTARVVSSGRVLLSGAATTPILRKQIESFENQSIPMTIVDGALSRLSLASPTITDALILATGAAVSPNLAQLLSKTRFACQLIDLPEVNNSLKTLLSNISSGLWNVDDDGILHNLNIPSSFMIGPDTDLLSNGNILFVAGAVSDRILKHLSDQKNPGTLIVRDFTKLFLTPDTYYRYLRNGGQIFVLQKSTLLAICLNPTSPQGFTLHSEEACASLSNSLNLPVYDVVQLAKSANFYFSNL